MLVYKWAAVTQRTGEIKERGRPLRIGRWLIILGGCKMRSPHQLARYSKACIEILTKFSHIYGPDGLQNT